MDSCAEIVYSGVASGNVKSLFPAGTPVVKTALTIQGTEARGIVRTIILTSLYNLN